jgi:hypothetical protein
MKTLTELLPLRSFIVPALFLFLTVSDARAQPMPPAPNVVPITVDGGPARQINRPFVSVTICVPGSATDCRTIDHVLVSTVSSGLRLLASAISPAISLPQQTSDSGLPLAECLSFLNGAAWGTIKTADVQIGGERALSIPIEIIGDPQLPPPPQACRALAGEPLNTVEALGGNGVLGLGPFLQDCGPGCAQASGFTPLYYGCTSSDCQPTPVAVDRQVPNPVGFFTSNNNGVMITLPSIPPEGAETVTGSLTFGIGTQANNALGNATVLALRPNNGSFTTVYKGQARNRSFIDPYAFGYYFFDLDIPACDIGLELYCPDSTLTLSASLQGADGAAKTTTFRVVNAIAQQERNPTFAAHDGIAASDVEDTFYWGLPFFFGKSVFTAIEGRSTPGGAGPYYAF